MWSQLLHFFGYPGTVGPVLRAMFGFVTSLQEFARLSFRKWLLLDLLDSRGNETGGGWLECNKFWVVSGQVLHSFSLATCEGLVSWGFLPQEHTLPLPCSGPWVMRVSSLQLPSSMELELWPLAVSLCLLSVQQCRRQVRRDPGLWSAFS